MISATGYGAFYVDDIKAAKDYLDSKGAKTFFGPFPVDEGPATGQSIVYFLAPWRLQMEIISYPKGMVLREIGCGGAVVTARPGEVTADPNRRRFPRMVRCDQARNAFE
jgi:hypothetical protein